MTGPWFQGRGRRACDQLTQDHRARTAAAQPGTYRRDQAPPGHARREQRAGRRPQLSGGPRLQLLPGSASVFCPPPGSCPSRVPGVSPRAEGRPARDARGRSGWPGRVTLDRAWSRGHCSIPCVACCPVSRSSDLCPRAPVGGPHRLLALPCFAVGGREGIQGPCAGLCVLTLVPQWFRGNLAKTARLGTAPENVAGFVDPSVLPRQLTSSG